jgi:superoxide dismutase, Cu-Zn family
MKFQKLGLMLLVLAMASPSWAAKGKADLKPTTEGSLVSGQVLLEDTKDGLKIIATIEGATAGPRGFHIHEFGSCENKGMAAGGHFNPKNAPHGHVTKQGKTKAHAGDLGNILIEENGTGHLEAVIPGVTLANGETTVGGRAFVFHEKEDDFGQPLGNAGGREACGLIQITE